MNAFFFNFANFVTKNMAFQWHQNCLLDYYTQNIRKLLVGFTAQLISFFDRFRSGSTSSTYYSWKLHNIIGDIASGICKHFFIHPHSAKILYYLFVFRVESKWMAMQNRLKFAIFSLLVVTTTFCLSLKNYFGAFPSTDQRHQLKSDDNGLSDDNNRCGNTYIPPVLHPSVDQIEPVTPQSWNWMVNICIIGWNHFIRSLFYIYTTFYLFLY